LGAGPEQDELGLQLGPSGIAVRWSDMGPDSGWIAPAIILNRMLVLSLAAFFVVLAVRFQARRDVDGRSTRFIAFAGAPSGPHSAAGTEARERRRDRFVAGSLWVMMIARGVG
jgi:hypothetical protein